MERVPSPLGPKADAKDLRLLIEYGTDINAKGIYGETALHHAVLQKDDGMARLLVDCGANVGATDFHGRTVLYLAKQSRKETMVWLLKAVTASA